MLCRVGGDPLCLFRESEYPSQIRDMIVNRVGLQPRGHQCAKVGGKIVWLYPSGIRMTEERRKSVHLPRHGLSRLLGS